MRVALHDSARRTNIAKLVVRDHHGEVPNRSIRQHDVVRNEQQLSGFQLVTTKIRFHGWRRPLDVHRSMKVLLTRAAGPPPSLLGLPTRRPLVLLLTNVATPYGGTK